MASKTENLELMRQLSRIARDSIRAAVPIRRFGRLRKGIRSAPVLPTRAVIFSIYYWARFVNDGRRGITAGPERPLIYFKDPKKDPRIRLAYPRRQVDNIRLTRAQFKRHRKAGDLIITDAVGPAEGLHFIEAGLREARKKIPVAVLSRIRSDVRRNIRRRRDSITGRL